jgi:hypothetical protein
LKIDAERKEKNADTIEEKNHGEAGDEGAVFEYDWSFKNRGKTVNLSFLLELPHRHLRWSQQL